MKPDARNSITVVTAIVVARCDMDDVHPGTFASYRIAWSDHEADVKIERNVDLLKLRALHERLLVADQIGSAFHDNVGHVMVTELLLVASGRELVKSVQVPRSDCCVVASGLERDLLQ